MKSMLAVVLAIGILLACSLVRADEEGMEKWQGVQRVEGYAGAKEDTRLRL